MINEGPKQSLFRSTGIKINVSKVDGLKQYLKHLNIGYKDRIHTYICCLFCRGLPLYRNQDRNRKWRRMDEEGGNFVYREGTLDQTTLNSYNFHKNNWHSNSNNNNKSSKNKQEQQDHNRNMIEDNTEEDIICIVSLKDIIT